MELAESIENFNCTILNFENEESLEIPVLAGEAGYIKLNIVQIKVNKNGEKTINGSDLRPMNVRALRAFWIYIMDQTIGWLYFVLWSTSFYPQVLGLPFFRA